MRVVALVFALVFSMSAHAEIDWNDSAIKWYGYEEGINELKKNSKLGIIVLYADWCTVCLEYSKIFKRPDVIKLVGDVVLIKANAEKELQVKYLKEFDQKYVPKTIVIDKSGNPFMTAYGSIRDHMFFLPPDDPEVFKSVVSYVVRANEARITN